MKAVTKKAAKAKGGAKASPKDLGKRLSLAMREQTRLRTAIVDLAAEVSKLASVAEAQELVARETGEKVRRLYADPIYSVPQETTRRVEALESGVDGLKFKLLNYVSLEAFGQTLADVKSLGAKLEDVAHDVGGLESRAQDLDDAVKSLEERATEPEAPPDGVKTTAG